MKRIFMTVKYRVELVANNVDYKEVILLPEATPYRIVFSRVT